MRTPVVLACGQGDAGGVVDVLAESPGMVIVSHSVRRTGRRPNGEDTAQSLGMAVWETATCR
jgi:hypothetical protein